MVITSCLRSESVAFAEEPERYDLSFRVVISEHAIDAKAEERSLKRIKEGK